MRAAPSGTGSRDGAMNGLRRSANGASGLQAYPRHTPAGRRIAVCPATYSGAYLQELWCLPRVRDAVIGFPAHGAWRKVETAMAARDVPAGESWAFRDHRTMAQVIVAEHAAADRAAWSFTPVS